MFLLALLAGLAQPQPAAAPPAQIAAVILADDARRQRLEGLLGRIGSAGRAYRSQIEDGLYYVSCVSAWRGNTEQTEGCIRSKLAGEAARVVLNGYAGQAGDGAATVACVGAGGAGRMSLSGKAASGEADALRTCLERALADAPAPVPARFLIAYRDRFEVQDVEAARAGAVHVLLMAVDHVGVPRGSTGRCHAQGRVARVLRGSPVDAGSKIELSVPCGTRPDRSEPRRISMAAMRRGTFAKVYVGSRRALLHFEPQQ